MVQYKKDPVRDRIVESALHEMACHGYRKATMATIARKAGVATGNTYRYFKNKEELFSAIVPDRFVRAIVQLLTQKIQSVDGVDDIRTLPPDSRFQLISEEVLDFMIENRLRLIILMTGADGSPHEGFSERIVRHLQELATEHFRSVTPGFTLSKMQQSNLSLAYRHFVSATSEILLDCKRDEDTRQTLTAYMRYHQAGLRAMLQKPSQL